MTIPARAAAEVIQNLAEALVLSSNAPVLLLDGELRMMAASTSYRRAFEDDPAFPDARLGEPFTRGPWSAPQLASLLRATATGNADIPAYEMDLVRPGRADRRLVLNAQKLSYGAGADSRVLLTITDVTEARLADKVMDDLLRDKAILMQELQHRIANSLQIIASVLMLTARRVNSDETRRHLYDAHNRVMSVATLQKQLAVSTVGEVRLAPYLTELCGSIAASMIADREQISLAVDAEDASADAEVSVSLGLIVTELVINALKHAFPGGRPGRIRVGYRRAASGWTLSVGDDGVGMPIGPGAVKSGLGSSIVAALASQLGARVAVVDAHPGTEVRIVQVRADGDIQADLSEAV